MSKLGIVQKAEIGISVEELKKRFPQKASTITEEVVDLINDATNDPAFSRDDFIQNLATYQSAMLEGRYSLKEYINAMKFCAYLETESNATEAYKRARANDPFVVERLGAATDSAAYKELAHQASRFSKLALVRKILTQSNMPLYLMFQGARYEAVGVLATEMQSAAYSKDRINAAKALLEQVKPPDNIEIELSVGPTSEAKSMQDSLNEQLLQIATNQKKLLDAGVDISEVQRLGITTEIIEAEVE